MRVSVIVPVYNAANLIGGCIRALEQQTVDEVEIVVVDDGSTDGTPEVVRKFPNVVLVEQPVNAGPAAARNAGLKVARAPVIAFTDADCEPAPDWLEKGCARLDADPDLAGVEGRTEPKGTPGTLTHQMRNVSGGLWMTCNMIYRRDALERAGGFDERFRLAFLEDSDVAFTVQENGGKIAWAPDAVVYHLVLDEGRAKFAREARKRMYNPLLFSKHEALYREHIATVVPALPPIHLRYMASVLAIVAFAAAGLWGGVVFAALVTAFYLRRVLHAYRARDLVSILQAAAHPFVQTYWVLRGALKFRTFSFKM
jgi:glycosyltransferase involved in cell wall biosynthesis